MNQKHLIQQRRMIWYKYHLPGGTNLNRIKQNVIYLSAAESLLHVWGKCRKCWELKKEKKHFITEAVDNKTKLRHDIVCLDTGEIFEIETTPARAKRFKDNQNVTVIMTNEEVI